MGRAAVPTPELPNETENMLLIVVQLLTQLNTMVKADQNRRGLKGHKKWSIVQQSTVSVVY